MPQIVETFSYVRLSYSDTIRKEEKKMHRFESNLRTLLRERGGRPRPRIGVKLLLTKENAREIDRIAKEFLELEERGHRLDHIKIRAARAPGDTGLQPSEEEAIDAQYRLALLRDDWMARGNPAAEDMQIDTKLRYVSDNFRCWVSPVMVVIDPEANVYPCYNFVDMRADWRIGNLDQQQFADFWGTPKHRGVVKNLKSGSVCNSPHGCNCRLIAYQRVLERSLRSQRTVPDALRAVLEKHV